MTAVTEDEVRPAQINKGHLIPATYEGTLRSFVLTAPDYGIAMASGAVFSDGRVAVMSQSGQVYERYTNTDTFAAAWAREGALSWCAHGPLDYDVMPRRFVFERHEDESGISGEGVALEGVVFPHGGVVLMWLGEVRSLVEWPSLELALAMHGHEGRTRLKWLDPV